MNTSVKTALAGAAIAVAAAFGVAMATHAGADTGNTGGAAHSGSYWSQPV